jgi:hypothetical protein
MVRIKVGPMGPVSNPIDDVEPRQQRRNAQERTYSPFETAT